MEKVLRYTRQCGVPPLLLQPLQEMKMPCCRYGSAFFNHLLYSTHDILFPATVLIEFIIKILYVQLLRIFYNI